MEPMYDSIYFDPEFDEGGPPNPRPLVRDIGSLPAGPFLASYLSTVDPTRLSGYDRVVALRAIQRLKNHVDAMHVRAVAAVVDASMGPGGNEVEDLEAAEAEVRCALHLTRTSAVADITLSLGLRDRLPRVLEALDRGDIDLRRARAIHKATENLSVEQARSVTSEVLETASELTSGQVRAWVGKLAMATDSDAAREHMKHAHEDRRVIVQSNASGTANVLILDLLPHQAAAVKNRLVHTSRNVRRKGEERSSDQIQADTAVDLLLGSAADTSDASQRKGSVHIKVDLTTLAELDENPGELAGYGPVISDIARKVAEDQKRDTWTYEVMDPESGQVVSTDVTRRRPLVALRRAIEAKYQSCAFPGCRMPAAESDIDHRKPYASGGLTTEENLFPLCRHDHGIKTRSGWTYEIVDREVAWTSPLGHRYRTARPPP